MRNRAQCRRCLDVIESHHRHDYRRCKCGAIFVDGGKDYHRVGGEPTSVNWIGDDDARIAVSTPMAPK